MITAKFGGSSLADAGQFKKVKRIVESDARRAYIIPSAPGRRFSGDDKITDLFYAAYEQRADETQLALALSPIWDRYASIAEELGLHINLAGEFSRISREMPKESRDYAAGRGEYLCGLLLGEYLGYEFVDPKDMIFFNADGELNRERTRRCIENTLRTVKNAVIPGFYGSYINGGGIKTFTRGGSDITGALIAAATGSELYENWTDVSGFLACDPRIVDKPVGIETLTYGEMRELACMGANVFHGDAVIPVKRCNIAINVRNTNAPGDKGTMIVPDCDAKSCGAQLVGVVGKRGYAAVTVAKDQAQSDMGFIRRALHVFEACSVPVEHMPSAIDRVTVIAQAGSLHDKRELLKKELLLTCGECEIDFFFDMALIAVVGSGIGSMPGMARRLFECLERAGINVNMVDFGSGAQSLVFGVADADYDAAVAAAYNEFWSR